MSEKILRCIRKSPRLTTLFRDLCEFEPLDEDAPGWFALESGEPFQVIARDGAGGRFCLCGPAEKRSKALLYVSSEGQAGSIANSLAEGVQMMIALPYWQDCLKFSAGGDLGKMQKAQALREVDLRQRRPDIETVRLELYRAFELSAPVSPLESLHQAVSAGSLKVVATSDGTAFDSLFNTFG